MPPKGQEMEDHYFGALKPRVSEYMHELDEELWKLGIPAKTKHNEVAPCQHELAPVFDTANVAVDRNQLTMEVMKKVAKKHGYVCLLHEKPFAGVNGSGKHNNWSIGINGGDNLLDPGKTPAENLQFLVFLLAVISAVDDYADLLRLSVASAGNDHRLGANEAPPAIISIFLGEELTAVLDAIEHDKLFDKKGKVKLETGATVLPHFFRDTTDRNRTSPFAFTGNKFEFRSLGSSFSVAGPNTVLNTAVAEELAKFAKELEGVKKDKLAEAVHELIKKALKAHKRVIFNGNGYTDEWVEEAKKRGLYNLRSTPEAIPVLLAKKNVELFKRHGIYSETELKARYEVMLENYCKTLHIEALTMQDMVHKQFLPALMNYTDDIVVSALNKKEFSDSLSTVAEEKLSKELSGYYESVSKLNDKLKADVIKAEKITDSLKQASFYHDTVIVDMEKLRAVADEAEGLIPEDILPYPTYEKMLFYV
ncbi:MAG: glutamine synthetase type III, partial [Lachnospiraceae bacterium]|nr:glutamine synthetase type III [Lachnospiraceae bacterium]